MNEEQISLYNEVLELMKIHKDKYPYVYNSSDTEFLEKEDFYISNNAYKGILLLKRKNKYIVDVVVSNGLDTIICGLLKKVFDSFEESKQFYNEKKDYIKKADISTVLLDGKTNYKID
ncbi:MAG: hypothetical protein ACK5HP_03775 [Bacilli bacterium]